MADPRTRELERLAAAGDPEAAVRLGVALRRSGEAIPRYTERFLHAMPPVLTPGFVMQFRIPDHVRPDGIALSLEVSEQPDRTWSDWSIHNTSRRKQVLERRRREDVGEPPPPLKHDVIVRAALLPGLHPFLYRGMPAMRYTAFDERYEQTTFLIDEFTPEVLEWAVGNSLTELWRAVDMQGASLAKLARRVGGLDFENVIHRIRNGIAPPASFAECVEALQAVQPPPTGLEVQPLNASGKGWGWAAIVSLKRWVNRLRGHGWRGVARTGGGYRLGQSLEENDRLDREHSRWAFSTEEWRSYFASSPELAVTGTRARRTQKPLEVTVVFDQLMGLWAKLHGGVYAEFPPDGVWRLDIEEGAPVTVWEVGEEVLGWIREHFPRGKVISLKSSYPSKVYGLVQGNRLYDAKGTYDWHGRPLD